MHHYSHLYIMYILVLWFTMTVVTKETPKHTLYFSSTENYSAYKNNLLNYIHSSESRLGWRYIWTQIENTCKRPAPRKRACTSPIHTFENQNKKRCNYSMFSIWSTLASQPPAKKKVVLNFNGEWLVEVTFKKTPELNRVEQKQNMLNGFNIA